ncbi:MAG TPA: GNAT family N-acetyltransferase [Nocardioidaceae bacterium]|nr:GNAT family N-acetyltransferase [Nocardioidaceae bacterium]
MPDDSSQSAFDYVVRPMRAADIPALERLSAQVFYELDVRTQRRTAPEPVLRTGDRAAQWRRRAEHVLAHDAAGCWVAEDASGPCGATLSLKRELCWVLWSFVVRSDLQGRGVGAHLLQAALSYGDGCLRAMLAASDDPRALRRYRLAGFTLHPAMSLRGTVDRALLPVVDRVREGSISDIDLMDSVDRRARGSGHGPDHELMASTYPLVVIDRPTGSGYAYVAPEGGPYLLAATNRRTASDLLWETLAASSPDEPCEIEYVTAANEWAVDVGMFARMELRTEGYLALRGMKPPMPYLPSSHFL